MKANSESKSKSEHSKAQQSTAKQKAEMNPTLQSLQSLQSHQSHQSQVVPFVAQAIGTSSLLTWMSFLLFLAFTAEQDLELDEDEDDDDEDRSPHQSCQAGKKTPDRTSNPVLIAEFNKLIENGCSFGITIDGEFIEIKGIDINAKGELHYRTGTGERESVSSAIASIKPTLKNKVRWLNHLVFKCKGGDSQGFKKHISHPRFGLHFT